MLNFLRTGQVQHNFDCTVITTNDFRFNTYNIFVYILVCYNLDLIEKLSTICRPWLTGIVLIWPSQIIDEIVYLEHMGKNRFSKTLKIFLSETTRLIALIFCVGLSSRYFSFLFKLCPWGHKLSRLWVLHVLHRLWLGLQSVIVVFPRPYSLAFFKMGNMKNYCLKPFEP